MTPNEALRRLRVMTASTSEPQLSDDELDLLLAGAKRADIYGTAPDSYVAWVPGQAYSTGDTVIPSTRNDHYYAATVAGTAGSTEPAFPTTDGGTVADGGVTWTESGAAFWTPTWDLNAAAAEGWRWKLGKTIGGGGSADIRVGDLSLSRAAVVGHIQSQIRLYQSRTAYSMSVQSQTAASVGAVVID